jgi:hypothetical protein
MTPVSGVQVIVCGVEGCLHTPKCGGIGRTAEDKAVVKENRTDQRHRDRF